MISALAKTNPFSALNLPTVQLTNLSSLGYLQMTPIQSEALPIALAGKDLIAQSKTGSGKTVAFAIPLIHKLNPQDVNTQALVLCPTRELSIQVSSEIRKVARYLGNIKILTLYGGQVLALQKSSLKGGAHIIVGTPGRILDHLDKNTLSLDVITTLVLDEADRMLEMGFLNDITEIIQAVPNKRQTFLFSATFPENIKVLSERFQKNPIHIHIEESVGTSDIDQKFVMCEADDKLPGLAYLLSHHQPDSVLIFCNTKVVAKEVYHYLLELGFSVSTLHGDMEQRLREQVLMQFRHQSCRVLVATDVAARGLDILDLAWIINFDVPFDTETYTHRIGRTGRAGNQGQAFTLASAPERYKLNLLREALNLTMPIETLDLSGRKNKTVLLSDLITLNINGGRKEALRPGDILGALTKDKSFDGKSVGKIDVLDYETFVSVHRKSLKKAYAQLSENKIKGKRYKIRVLD